MTDELPPIELRTPSAPRAELLPLPAPYSAQPATWLVTFADLLSLILVFFVMMFAANAVRSSEWEKLATSLSDRLNPAAAAMRDKGSAADARLKAPMVEGRRIAWLETLFTEKLASDPVLGDSTVRNLGDRLAIAVPADLLFRENGDRLMDPAAFQAVARLAGLLRDLDNRVAVIAYTDPVAAEAAGGAHWGLSLRRAVAVARTLERNGYGRPIEIFGHGAPPFDDLAADLPQALQSRLARRIELVIREYERVGAP